MVLQRGGIDGDVPGFGVDDVMIVRLSGDLTRGGVGEGVGGGCGNGGGGGAGIGEADVEGVEKGTVVDGDCVVAAVFGADGGVEGVGDVAGVEEVEG